MESGMGKISCRFVGNPVRAFDVSVAKEETTMHSVAQRVFRRTETILIVLNGGQSDVGRFYEKKYLFTNNSGLQF